MSISASCIGASLDRGGAAGGRRKQPFLDPGDGAVEVREDAHRVAVVEQAGLFEEFAQVAALGRFSRTFESNSWAPRSASVSRIWLSMCAAVTSTDCTALQVEDHVLARAQFLLEVGVELLRRAEEEAALQLDDDRLVAFLESTSISASGRCQVDDT